MNLHNRQNLLLLTAIAGVALLAADRFLLTPLNTLWKNRSSRIASLKNSINQGSQLVDRESHIRQRWNNILTNTLSPEISIAENQVLRAFDRWSQTSRIGVTGIKPQWKHHRDDFSVLQYRVDAFGNISAITRFLYEIENDPLGVKVDSVEITARDNRGEQLTLGLQVSALQLNLTSNP